MNQSNINHALYAVAFQLVGLVLPITHALWITGAASVGFFLSREHAQRELQISLATGRPVTSLKKWEGFTGWVRDRYLDAGMPALACLLVAIVL